MGLFALNMIQEVSGLLRSVHTPCRAIIVEVCRRADDVQNQPSSEKWQRQLAALEALQIFAPMGHALGLSMMCAELEDRCFQVLSHLMAPELVVVKGQGPHLTDVGDRSNVRTHAQPSRWVLL